YLGIFKAVAYGIFGYLICQKTPALFFLRHRGGETVEVPATANAAEEVAPSGVVMTLTAAEKDRISPLAQTLTWVGLVLLVAGFFQAVAAGTHLAAMSTGHYSRFAAASTWLHLAEGG